MHYLLPRLLGLALMALPVTACVTSGAPPKVVTAPRAPLPAIPADLKACFTKTVGRPPAGDLTAAIVLKLVADLKASEASKTSCGRRLIKWYEGIRA